MATDVDETSEAAVHEISGENDPTEGDAPAAEEAAEASPANEFERSAAAARESLIAELQRTVDTVSTAVDDATARTFEQAQEEARRQAEAASARVEALERDGLVKLRELADDLLERSTWLSNQLAELTKHAETTAADLKAEEGPAKFSEAPPAAEPETETFEPESASLSEHEHEDKPGGLGFFRRRQGT